MKTKFKIKYMNKRIRNNFQSFKMMINNINNKKFSIDKFFII